MNNYRYAIDNDQDNDKRIDSFITGIKNDFDLTRTAVQKLIADQCITVNNKIINKNYKLRLGDVIEIIIPPPVQLDVIAQNIALEFVYEDKYLAVVNKPKGMVVHPAPGNHDGTMVNALLYHCKGELSGINGIIRPGIVHRIDKDTSGLLIVAKTDAAHIGLAQQIKEHSFSREYYALLCGMLGDDTGTINAPIGRDKKDRKKMCVTNYNSKEAITHFQVLERFKNHTLVKFNLETGRTHQIRVHSAYIGYPVYGDGVYGKNVKDVQGQTLHAKKIGFAHPITKQYMEFDSELPEYFKKILIAMNTP